MKEFLLDIDYFEDFNILLESEHKLLDSEPGIYYTDLMYYIIFNNIRVKSTKVFKEYLLKLAHASLVASLESSAPYIFKPILNLRYDIEYMDFEIEEMETTKFLVTYYNDVYVQLHRKLEECEEFSEVIKHVKEMTFIAMQMGDKYPRRYLWKD